MSRGHASVRQARPAARCFLLGLAAAATLSGVAPAGTNSPWQVLEPGLEFARFATVDTTVHRDGDLTVLRVDPGSWRLRILTSGGETRRPNLTVRAWCHDYGLVAAVNAGMFMVDQRTHVGYLRADDVEINGNANAYLSAAAFDPRRPDLPPFRIFDLDETALTDVAADYRNVIQNLRLVKRPAEPRWHRRDRAWRETALGEDNAGRALLISCRTPMTMPDLIGLLLALPLDLQALQHLEGGSEAQFHIVHQTIGDSGDGGDWLVWPVPNVIGVVPRLK